MEELDRLKSNFDAKILSDADYLQHRDAIINFNEDLYKDAPQRDRIARHAKELKEFDAFLTTNEDVVVDLNARRHFQNHLNLFNSAIYYLSSEVAGRWKEDTLFKRVCDKALVHHLGLLPLILKLIKDSRMPPFAIVSGGSFCWNYAELDRHRRELVEAGVLDIALEVLSKGSPDAAAKFTGVLWALVEYEQCRELVITSGLVDILVRRAQELTLPTNTQLLNWAACRPRMLQVLGACPRPPLKMIVLDQMVAYFRVLTAANFIADESLDLSSLEHHVSTCLEQIEDFIVTMSYRHLRAIEENDNYTWVTMGPYVDLLRAKNSTVYRLGHLALANLMQNGANRIILCNEGLEDLVHACTLAGAETCPVEEAVWKDAISSSFKWTRPPALRAIVEWHLIDSARRRSTQTPIDKPILDPHD